MLRGIEPAPLHVEELSLASSAPRRDGLDVEQPSRHISSEVLEAHLLPLLLDRLRHRAPILLVEHDMDAVFALADRISVLVYGQIIATGSVAEIRSDAEVRRAYLGEEDEA